MYLATHFNPIYWNTACLIVNSGSLEDTEDESTSYVKLAKAIGNIRSAGIKVSLADINNSSFGFKPEVENNQILFGLKGILNVGDDVVDAIIAHRPYKSIRDFCNKVKLSKQPMIALIKAGAFDNLEADRRITMAWYIWHTCEKKKRITMQNMNGLLKYNLVPKEEKFELPLKVFEFNRYLKDRCKVNKTLYRLDERAIVFLNKIELDGIINQNDNGSFFMNAKDWEKVYSGYMDVFREWMAEDQANILKSLNKIIFKEDWEKYASGTLSAWEMEVLCFYYHTHELAHINKEKYGLVDFKSLLEEPEVDRSFVKNNRRINIYKLHKICGTCIAKDKNKSSITLLTTDGVVEVKFRKPYFAMFDKQISQPQPDGKKKIIEKSWFKRGSLLIIQGIRQGDSFITKNYANSNSHQLYKIDSIDDKGNVLLRNERVAA